MTIIFNFPFYVDLGDLTDSFNTQNPSIDLPDISADAEEARLAEEARVAQRKLAACRGR